MAGHRLNSLHRDPAELVLLWFRQLQISLESCFETTLNLILLGNGGHRQLAGSRGTAGCGTARYGIHSAG